MQLQYFKIMVIQFHGVYQLITYPIIRNCNRFVVDEKWRLLTNMILLKIETFNYRQKKEFFISEKNVIRTKIYSSISSWNANQFKGMICHIEKQ